MSRQEPPIEERLESGWAMIETARDEGRADDVTRLTDYWLILLERYEREYVPAAPTNQPATASLWS